MPKPTEEQIIRILGVVAAGYAKNSGGRFQRDELVNHCWLLGSAQRLPDVRMVWQRARYDMIAYMREQNTEPYRRVGMKMKKQYMKYAHPNIRLDHLDELEFLLRGLGREHRLEAHLASNDMTQREIAKVVGDHQVNIWYALNRIIKPHMRARMGMMK